MRQAIETGSAALTTQALRPAPHRPHRRRLLGGVLDAETTRLFEASRGTYGFPRFTHDLHQAGWRVSKNTVVIRMAELGLAGRPPKKWRSLTRQGGRPAAAEALNGTLTKEHGRSSCRTWFRLPRRQSSRRRGVMTWADVITGRRAVRRRQFITALRHKKPRQFHSFAIKSP
ncbi:IS3 family transposase [Streptosporangium pseudovulgare]|uniref:HTH-like domain-containing protein n=1 Tax=Streptosporangium pseudovulgare TaxID=35765 RepID=A0ABQ2RKU5_9ACTN|nr:IS3 family transposase [Streptosporangium pseudovulgare]GGQ34884.1 hypothetical protein GCM10010140_76240 [Streptosporangium pseudovulgare]